MIPALAYTRTALCGVKESHAHWRNLPCRLGKMKRQARRGGELPSRRGTSQGVVEGLPDLVAEG